MNFLRFEGKGYIPTYAKTKLTDELHAVFGFNTVAEVIPIMKMKNICAQTKKKAIQHVLRKNKEVPHVA